MKKKKSIGRKNVQLGAGAGAEINTLELIRTIFEARSFLSHILYDVRGRIRIHNAVFIRSMADNKIASADTCILLQGILKMVVMVSKTFIPKCI
jgi:hypothetical protein